MEVSTVTMVDSITTGVGSIVTFVGNIITAITSGSWNALLPVIGLAVAVMFVMFAVRTVKSLVKGY